MCPECKFAEVAGHGPGCSRNKPRNIRTDQILEEAAKTFRERNAIYKDNTKRAGEVLAALFPQGITLRAPIDHEHFHLLVLIVVKLTRHTVAWENGGHQDSIRDLAVYAAMIEALIQ